MRRVVRALHEYLADAVLVLLAIAIFVIVPGAAQRWIGRAQDVDVASKLVATVLAVVAAVATYRRFFKGRTFSPRLRLNLSHKAVCAISNGSILHAVDVEAENIGAVTIWEPEIKIRVRELDRDVICSIEAPSTEGIETPMETLGVSGIEPGETVVFHYRFAVPPEIEVFRVGVEVLMDRRHAWHRATTIKNGTSVEVK